MQWLGDRKRALTAFAEKRKSSIMNLETQLDFIKYEYGSHYGIAQWDKVNRWPVVKKQIKKEGLDPETLSGQLYGLYWEAKDRGDWDDLMLTKTIEGAMQSWLTNFEISGEKKDTFGYNMRLEYAMQLYNEYTSSKQKTSAPTDKENSTKTYV
jgi:hypothetical protein